MKLVFQIERKIEELGLSCKAKRTTILHGRGMNAKMLVLIHKFNEEVDWRLVGRIALNKLIWLRFGFAP